MSDIEEFQELDGTPRISWNDLWLLDGYTREVSCIPEKFYN